MVQLRRWIAAGAAVWLVTGVNPAAALDRHPDYIVGGFGVFDTAPRRDPSASGLDLRMGLRYWLSEPSVGGMTITERGGGSDRGGLSFGGVGLELTLGDSFIFTPSIAAGLQRSSDAKDPTNPIEIRAGLEAAYEFSNEWRIGAGIYHFGSTGTTVDVKNNSSEMLTFTLSVPIGSSR
jgi:hypothetical protein